MGSGVEVRHGHHREGGTGHSRETWSADGITWEGFRHRSGFPLVAGEETSKVNLGRSEENLEMPRMKKAGQVTSSLRGELRHQFRGSWRPGRGKYKNIFERIGFLCF